MVRTSLVVAAMLVAAPASAAPDKPPTTRVQLPGGITLSIDGWALAAARGTLVVKLVDAPFKHGPTWTSIDRVTVVGEQVTIGYTDLCSEGESSFSIHAVEARLENVAALALHQRKRYAEAVPGFARAIALDPGYELAALNLASALAQQGKVDDAVAALAPRLASNPAGTYVRILDDPELAPLLATAAVRAVRAKTPGTATVATLKQLAFSPERKLIAARIDEACGYSDAGRAYIELRSPADQLVTRLPIVDCMDLLNNGTGKIDAAGKRRVAANQARIDRVFADLGFVTAPPAGASKVREPVTVDVHDRGDVVKLLVGKRVVATKPFAGEHVDWHAFVPAANAMVVAWSVTQPEAECGPQPPYTGIQVLAVP